MVLVQQQREASIAYIPFVICAVTCQILPSPSDRCLAKIAVVLNLDAVQSEENGEIKEESYEFVQSRTPFIT